MTHDANGSGAKTVVVDVSGPNAFERARERLQTQTAGVDPERVEHVHAEVSIAAEKDDEAESDGGEVPKHRRGGDRPRLTEADRSYGDIRANTAHHMALRVLTGLGATSEATAVESTEVESKAESVDDIDYPGSTIQSALSTLYERRAVDRDRSPEGHSGHVYWISDHGRKLLEQVGG